MKAIKDLEHTDFTGLVGEEFAIGHYKAKLTSVSLGPDTPSEFREQFSLIFECPDNFVGDHDTLAISHDTIGAHSVFISKVMGSNKTPNLQVVFS
ncbi:MULTISPECIES: DUF6916 family protein [Pseudovibrio]|uniref:DUF6916 family protein n=1 Tax=Stappiaceae TaxID=2821832 RepID=UPI0023655A56|nr:MULTISPECIES: hypothetical protein [Pseudovibrio]MDD7911573.1 hypothetical protein [Pseudovibrio exalbescens]MDX5594308.1 hypothetical protein [Pseudovibrio sp. SPO723]